MPSPPRREILIEFRRVGTVVKASAIDPETLTEVSVVGPARGSQEMLRRTVLAKLDYVLRRNAKPPAK
ncbi:MAG: hypothetical protein WCO00_11790 [Rhodospirillaceae bacterium]